MDLDHATALGREQLAPTAPIGEGLIDAIAGAAPRLTLVPLKSLLTRASAPRLARHHTRRLVMFAFHLADAISLLSKGPLQISDTLPSIDSALGLILQTSQNNA